jgi:hypothetical protein
MDFAEGFGLVGMIFLVYAAVLAFFLPFYVMGIYNQSKEINNNLKRMDSNLLILSSLIADGLDKGSKSSDQKIC